MIQKRFTCIMNPVIFVTMEITEAIINLITAGIGLCTTLSMMFSDYRRNQNKPAKNKEAC